MDSFAGVPIWDLSSGFGVSDDDFLALLQKQFPISNAAPTDVPAALLDDGIDPQALSRLPATGGNTPPLTDDSSPSPPSTTHEESRSRRESVVIHDHDGLKRKASDDDLDDEDNSHGNKKSGSSSKRKSGQPSQDEARLMRRKEQNRAAQRAFRERKEKHVKDLEDKVAELEEAHKMTQSENENLRDLLTRLQDENKTLKQTAFTFTVPRNPAGATSPTSTVASPTSAFPAGASSLASPLQPQAQPSTSSLLGGIDWSALTTFDPSALSMLDEPADVQMDGTSGSSGPYTTIASNPMFMSFAEPPATNLWDMFASVTNSNANPSGGSNSSNPPPFPGPLPAVFDSSPFTSWNPTWSPPAGSNSDMASLDDLFGTSSMVSQSPLDLGGLMSSPPNALSPVSHALRQNSSSSSSSSASSPGAYAFGGASGSFTNTQPRPSPLASSDSSSPLSSISPSPVPAAASPGDGTHSEQTCPKTKAEFAAHVVKGGASKFVGEAPTGPVPAGLAPEAVSTIRMMTGHTAGTTEVSCAGSVFPKTEKSEKNVEVLTAWRSITANPKFKDVDINELCSEFTSKAKCDGTKVVLDPNGVHQIIDKFTKTKQ